MITLPENFSATPDLLKEQVILVTGATGSFGKVVSIELARHGATWFYWPEICAWWKHSTMKSSRQVALLPQFTR